ncbi:unnamed protein product [Larinioides sclopetarius]|uniref:Uncharacterized protein n=1 Tax=Larinioides sclopetarius TaxID=280406 RepID=A0AAV1ZGG6_9ARAC
MQKRRTACQKTGERKKNIVKILRMIRLPMQKLNRRSMRDI